MQQESHFPGPCSIAPLEKLSISQSSNLKSMLTKPGSTFSRVISMPCSRNNSLLWNATKAKRPDFSTQQLNRFVSYEHY